jgi:hypothetical protein
MPHCSVGGVASSYVDGPGWQAVFDGVNGLVGCGHMSGLLARRIWPLALMKSDGRGPDHCGELCAHDDSRVVLGFGGGHVVHHVSLRSPNS